MNFERFFAGLKMIMSKYIESIIFFTFLFGSLYGYYYTKKIKHKDVFKYGIKAKACINDFWTGTDNDPQMSYLFKYEDKYYYGNYAVDPNIFVSSGIKVHIGDSVTVFFFRDNPKKNILGVDLYEYYSKNNIYYYEMYNK
jgi:hypothetical protein